MAQYGWTWCKNCQGLYYSGTPGNPFGRCPAGGGHNPGTSFNYHLDVVTGGSAGNVPGQQRNWRWCGQCQCLFFAGFETSGYCPGAGTGAFPQATMVLVGGHNYTGSVEYCIPYASQSPPGSQGGWQWCRKCQGLFYAGNPTSGACPAGGGHDHTGSVGYALNHG